MNLITPDVMRAMTNASSSAATANVSMGVYRQAKAKGDDAGMDRAAGYAADSMHTAAQQSQAAQDAVNKAQAEAREQADLERRQALEDARAETRQQDRAELRQAAQEALNDAQESNRFENSTPETGAADIADAAGAPEKAAVDAQTISPRLSAKWTDRANAAGVLYTRLGEIRPAATEQKLSVTA